MFMKKMFKRVLLVALAILSVAALASCAAKPQLNFEDAEANLKKAGYTVKVTDVSEEYAESVLYAANLEGDTIYITRFAKESTARVFYRQLEKERDSAIEKMKEEIKVYKHIIKAYKNELSESEVNSYKDAIKDIESDIKAYKEDNVIGYNDAYVWQGSKNAIKATKK